jgi:hypothetical protein
MQFSYVYFISGVFNSYKRKTKRGGCFLDSRKGVKNEQTLAVQQHV